MKKTKAQASTPATTATPAEEEPEELITELALGSDGRIYVNASHLTAKEREGRRMFQGYAMTPEEAQRAAAAVHQIAFNVTVSAKRKATPRMNSATRPPATRSRPKR
ncbi:hypothetical protein [Polyangium spumosum]|uniref:Uncharacterized protein n=1 Tax=Polyangium spumosum TaxID=889282 RepID=A0A6N7PEG1_9BACT|nr:hypothetical protein [Polyangium spumosum]MRG90349.1 hypothetical protein [Polyangium spumosum]